MKQLSALVLARYLWALPCTLVGLAAVLLLLPTQRLQLRWHRGVLEACLALPPGRLPFDAITLGHVVLARSPEAMAHCRAHERVHVRQCERWGPLFFPAYLAAGAKQWLRGRGAWRDNPFEIPARAVDAIRAGGCGPAAGSSPPSA